MRVKQVKDKDMNDFYRGIEIDTLTRTLWGEARGEGTAGMEAVASVVLNRVKIAAENNGRWWWGANIIQVCQKPYQFSCWNRSNANFQKLQAVDEKIILFRNRHAHCPPRRRRSHPGFNRRCHALPRAGHRPLLGARRNAVAAIGNHIFYRLTEG